MNVDTQAIREAEQDITKLWTIDEALRTVRQLLDENAMLSKQKKNVMEAYNEQKEEIRSLRAGYTSANEKQNEELYFWEPYAENHLETLTGGVVIRAEWIRQLIEEAVEAQAKEIERLRDTLKHRDTEIEGHIKLNRQIQADKVALQSELDESNGKIVALHYDKAAAVEALRLATDGNLMQTNPLHIIQSSRTALERLESGEKE